MREHEVPTHVQAEDRVLLWFTFPQVVAIVAVCALSYGAYRYAPVGPSEVRMAIAVLLGLAGVAAVVGKIGGRRLPLVAADLLKYRLGAKLYAGPPSHLVRSEPPAPTQPVKPVRSGPGPLRLMARRAGKTLRGLRPRRKGRERKGGRMPFRPHRWFGKPRRTEADKDTINGKDKDKRRKLPKSFLPVMAAVALAAAVATVPQAALADGHEDGGWSSDEIEFQPPQPVEGRRLFVERLSVTGDRAAVTLRAATDIDLRVRAFGGPQGNWLRFWGSASLDEGERIDYSLPLHGPNPSLTFSWEDTLGQAGAVTVEEAQLPFPLPSIEGELCNLRVTSLGWSPGAVEGVVESECVARTLEPVELQTVAGHAERHRDGAHGRPGDGHHGDALRRDRRGPRQRPLRTQWRDPLPASGRGGRGRPCRDHPGIDLEASLSIPMPPLTVLTHHPARVEHVTRTVHLHRPGDSDSDSETATVACEDGATSSATATAYAYVPSATIAKEVTVALQHPEHVKAETVERSPITRSRDEALAPVSSTGQALALSVGADDPFEALVLPEPEPEDPPAEQTPAGGLSDWFRILGWEWPW